MHSSKLIDNNLLYRPINRSFFIIFLHLFLQTMSSFDKKIVKCVMEEFDIKKELEYQHRRKQKPPARTKRL